MSTTRNQRLTSRLSSRLSSRLEALLEELGPCELLLDVAADHARLALAAVERGIAARAVAIDLHQAPLASAKERAQGARVHLVRGDGLQCIRIPRGAKVSLVLAGIGGDLAVQILERSPEASNAERIVAQPERHARELRVWMREHGFHLTRERVLAESRRLHLVLRFERRAGTDPAYGAFPLSAELHLGPLLLASKEATARSFLHREHLRLRKLGRLRPDFAAARKLLAARFQKPASP